jgi:Glutathione S-transferase
MGSKDLKFWGAGTARTLRPIWMAEELDLEYELFPIGPRTGETRTKEYTDLNPKQKVPWHERWGICSFRKAKYLEKSTKCFTQPTL